MSSFGSLSRAVILKARLANTALPNIFIRMCLLVILGQAAFSSNSASNSWKSPLKGSPSIHICTRPCCALEVWSEGLNLAIKSASILVKV